MIGSIWHLIFFDPVYNGLVFFIDAVPGGDVGLAVVCITVVVKTLLLPLSIKATKTQAAMREIDPKLKAIRKEVTDRQEQAEATMKAYKEAGINPFASILLMFLQIPIIIALYFAVAHGGGVSLPKINTAVLYSFIPHPETISTIFLGILDITQKSLPLAVLAGITQFIQVNFSMPKLSPRDPEAKANMKDDFARSMQMQMRYGMPLVITFFAYSISSTIALYFIVSNLMGIVQELVVRKHRTQEQTAEKDD